MCGQAATAHSRGCLHSWRNSVSLKKGRDLKPRPIMERPQGAVGSQFLREGPFLIIGGLTLAVAAHTVWRGRLTPGSFSAAGRAEASPPETLGRRDSGGPSPARPQRTLPSCACGMSVARGSARSSSWPGTGRAGRRPASPRSGLASRTGRAPWSSSTSTPRRSRCCWLWVEGAVSWGPRAGSASWHCVRLIPPRAGPSRGLTLDFSHLPEPCVADHRATWLGTQSSDRNLGSSSSLSKVSLGSVEVLFSRLQKAFIPK